tara:strand:- start:224 stop:343 length:120 start_codon:yes stop_codon:yes gene_type:complete
VAVERLTLSAARLYTVKATAVVKQRQGHIPVVAGKAVKA